MKEPNSNKILNRLFFLNKIDSSYILVFSALLFYIIGYIIYYPNILTITDEIHYVSASYSIAHNFWGFLFGKKYLLYPDTYPIGTPLVQAPFVFFGGWQAATIPSLISYILTVIIMVKWLQEEKKSPIYALIVFAFPAALVIARSAMSDCLSGLIVTLGLYTFWKADHRHPVYLFLSGLFAGLSTLFKEPNILIFFPFFLEELLRREKKAYTLIVGCTLGIIIRFISADIFFGSPFYIRPAAHGFSFLTIFTNFPYYFFVTTVLIPGGLIAIFLYKGPHRYALISSISIYLLLFLSFKYTAWETSFFKRIVLSGRYIIPILPLFTIALADVIPDIWLKFKLKYSLLPKTLSIIGLLLLFFYFAVHPFFYHYFDTRSILLRDIYKHVNANDIIYYYNTTPNIYFAKFYSGYDLVYCDLTNKNINNLLNLSFHKKPIKFIMLFQNNSNTETKFKKLALGNTHKFYKLVPYFEKNYLSGEHLVIYKIASYSNIIN